MLGFCMSDEKTLVKVVHHKGFLGDSSLEVGKIFVDGAPVDVLKSVFLDYHVASYLGNSPWMINVGEDHTYLDVSRFSGDNKFMKYVNMDEEFYKGIGSARREESISGGERIKMAENLLEKVYPERGSCRMVFHDVPNARVYSDILSVLGFDVDFSLISGWISEIANREHWEDFRERTERIAELNRIPWDSVVGAEV